MKALPRIFSKWVAPSCCVAAIWMASCGSSAGSKESGAAGAKPQPQSAEAVVPSDSRGIQTQLVARKALLEYLEVPGRVQPDPTSVVRIFPPLGGRVLSLEVRPGDRVHKGQVLASLASSEASGARAEYVKAKADAEVKEKALRRANLLYENQVLSEKEYQQASADAEVAQAELERTRDRLRLLGVSPEGAAERVVVTAPRDGVILDIGAAPGELSKALDAATPLATLADLKTVWITGDVYEKDIAALRTGDEATVIVSAYPNEAWKARVSNLSNTLDPVTRTQRLRVVLPNPGLKLKPEMFATIRVLRSKEPGIAIPATAVVRKDGGTFVFVQSVPGRFVRKAVTLGRNFADQVEVKTGLQEGDTVVVDGALLLRETGS